MEWFDDFTRAVARGKTLPRATLLQGIAQLAAGAVIRPGMNGGAAPFGAVSHPLFAAAGGACSYTLGPTTTADVSLGSGALQLTVHSEHAFRGRTPALTMSTTIVDLTASGESLAHVEATASSRSSLRLSAKYGARVTGVRDTQVVASGAGSRPAPATQPGSELDAALRPDYANLVAGARSIGGSCSSLGEPRRFSDRQAFRPHTTHRALTREHAVQVAQAGGATYSNLIDVNASYQNYYGPRGAMTPHCTAALKSVENAYIACLFGSAASFIFCPPCAANAILSCVAGLAGGYAGASASGAPCNEVSCSGSSDLGLPVSCDSGTTCCGYQCCNAGDYCTPAGFCCPSNATTNCGDGTPRFNDSVCCLPSQQCIPGKGCLTCPPGTVGYQGNCCTSVCGGQCCTFSTTCASHGGCALPFGEATPSPTPNPLQRILCQAGFAVCTSRVTNRFTHQSQNVDVCCAAGLTCCGGQCCGRGQQCCAVGDGEPVCRDASQCVR